MSWESRLRTFLRYGAGGNPGILRLEREPCYFDALQVEGTTTDVLVARDGRKIVALGTRSEKPCFINGIPEPKMTGYVSNVLIAPGYRNSSLFFRGYRLFKQLHQAGQCTFYLLTVLAGNMKVLNVLQKNAGFSLLTPYRAGLPLLEPWGTYNTYVLGVTPSGVNSTGVSGLSVRRAEAADVPAIITFFRNHGPRRQFFPSYSEDDILSRSGLLKGLSVNDIFLARQGGELVGTLGVWNQTGFRQWHVHDEKAYTDMCTILDPAHRGSQPSPSCTDQGSKLNCRMLALMCITGDRPDIFSALLGRINLCCRSKGDLPFLLLGLHETDPLNACIKRQPHVLFESHMYVLSWNNTENRHKQLNKMIPYLELGSL